jgi:hypothetical protein
MPMEWMNAKVNETWSDHSLFRDTILRCAWEDRRIENPTGRECSDRFKPGTNRYVAVLIHLVVCPEERPSPTTTNFSGGGGALFKPLLLQTISATTKTHTLNLLMTCIHIKNTPKSSFYIFSQQGNLMHF